MCPYLHVTSFFVPNWEVGLLGYSVHNRFILGYSVHARFILDMLGSYSVHTYSGVARRFIPGGSYKV